MKNSINKFLKLKNNFITNGILVQNIGKFKDLIKTIIKNLQMKITIIIIFLKTNLLIRNKIHLNN